MEYLWLTLGLMALVLGGEFLVRGAVSIALKAKISPLVVGMTVVSFGTSAPELLVSLSAVFGGYPDVSVGAVVGSNISNIGLVLGITVLIFPIAVNHDSLRIDWPLMILATFLFYFFAMNGELSWWEGLVFIAILSIFTFWLILRSRKEGIQLAAESEVEDLDVGNPAYKDILFLSIGMVALYFGADWLIQSVVSIASSRGVSEKLISVTIVAFGTSLPELVTSAMAAFRKETDISIGNLIGSNIFNIFAILGVTAILHPLRISDSINQFDVYFLLGISLLLFPMMLFGKKIGRWKGFFLILFYAFYIYFSIVVEK
ncbi:calcium/sodium antiporter [Vicingaceae bacterium]|nr:calcium/sodium antiporter [Vicingaceae bacterium]MDC1451299.1 calcium/sodium antiporter [Vicingaceae bacterium]